MLLTMPRRAFELFPMAALIGSLLGLGVLASNSELIVAESSSTVLGFCSYGDSRDRDTSDGTGEIYAIYVAPEHWSNGVGRALLQESVRNLKGKGFSCITVWVLSQNARAIRFYERAGFNRCAGSGKDIQIGGEQLLEVRYEVAAADLSLTAEVGRH